MPKFTIQTVLLYLAWRNGEAKTQQYCLLLIHQKFCMLIFSNVKRFKLPQCGLLSAVKSLRQNNNIHIYTRCMAFVDCWVVGWLDCWVSLYRIYFGKHISRLTTSSNGVPIHTKFPLIILIRLDCYRKARKSKVQTKYFKFGSSSFFHLEKHTATQSNT